MRHHATEYGIDATRIGAMGGSSGAHLVSLLGVLDGDGDPKDASPVNRESAKVQVVVARVFSEPRPGLERASARPLIFHKQLCFPARSFDGSGEEETPNV